MRWHDGMAASAHGNSHRSGEQQQQNSQQLFSTAQPTLVLLLHLQTISLLVWFTVLAGCYALFIPIIQDAAAQAAVAVLYTAAAIAVTATYFIVRQVDCPVPDDAYGSCMLFIM
jgi:hypothetical protein